MSDVNKVKFVEVGKSGTGFCLSQKRRSSARKWKLKKLSLIVTS